MRFRSWVRQSFVIRSSNTRHRHYIASASVSLRALLEERLGHAIPQTDAVFDGFADRD
ncbi:MAG: hypothetical protein HC872_05435 [Gammaproteobacteria bacterium]|nr:hypothetical protein [Gammaproteobacteria bacterium]